MNVEIACHNEDFGTAPQISIDDIEQVIKNGYKSIINNRPDGEGGNSQPLSVDIEAAAKKAGLLYVYLPVVSGQVTIEQVQEMAKLLEKLPRPILAFCRSGARSTSLYMMAKQLAS